MAGHDFQPGDYARHAPTGRAVRVVQAGVPPGQVVVEMTVPAADLVPSDDPPPVGTAPPPAGGTAPAAGGGDDTASDPSGQGKVFRL